ncbi:MAG: helix-turn-helix domain-containing protein [Clostridia bacterium]|nr:helix-turn-helix domain-containing protein [Clostridia bacterium]
MYNVHYIRDDSDIYYPDKKFQNTVSVIEVGAMQPWRNYRCDITHGNIYVLQYIMSGEGVFNGQSFRGPCFFVLAPNDRMSYSVNADSEPFEQYWIKLEGEKAESYLKDAGIPTETGVYPCHYAKQAKKVLTELTTDLSYTNRDDRYFMLSGFLSICEFHSNSLKERSATGYINPYTVNALEYIHAHYSEPVSEITLAEHLHISKSYMHKIFCRDMRMTPNYYLNKYRIQCAKELLMNTSHSVAQIAESIGFANGDYFCRVFQKYMYCSPTKYRKNNSSPMKNEFNSTVIGNQNNKNGWIYIDKATMIMVREADIRSSKGGKLIRLGLIADPHYNYCNAQDLAEAHPTVMSTFKNRKWLANGQTVDQTNACLEYISDCDQIVVLGDILDYLSHGAMELAQTHIFKRYPEVIACIGNHDVARRIQGDVKEIETLDERRQILRNGWIHNIDYYSKVIDDRVMLIQMDNASRRAFVDSQVNALRNDIELARKHGYIILLFFHMPLSINDPSVTKTFPLRKNFSEMVNFNNTHLIGYHSAGASRDGYELITTNADIIKGVFCGDMHSDYYTEIKAKNADGTDAIIPQYILTGVPHDNGHVMIVNIK